MTDKLILPMMMFGRYKDYVKEPDPEKPGKYRTVYEKNKRGKLKPKTKWIVHSEANGDPGFFPSVNHIYNNTRGGGKKLTKAAEDLFNRWQLAARDWCFRNQWEMAVKEKVVVEVTAYFPNKQVRDTNNVFKLLMDSLEHVIFDNDYYALPRVKDFLILDKDCGIRPYFELVIFRKEDEAQIELERAEQLVGL
ncbi:Endodeoxyribonuclease RusA [Paenibacillus sp. UNC496MF]|uniref:RusA family crossover junction endodeoxyribonuclease n=1 Tax=Paenibacillus sp. UNC496MF TaxID=1502753 RepID=UPI0008DF9D8F|nr:RusA family crossover junction endodeoxyribonuclease [Paenibacillus sp. UNC496MF]SFJ65112.1 Endodeoxyribonuclease RusA [Paenibacillus sp. UNC496MF]